MSSNQRPQEGANLLKKMTGLERFEADCREIDEILKNLNELREISRQWGGLLEREEVKKSSLIRRRRELEGMLGYAAYDLRGDVWRVIAGWDTTLSPHWMDLARSIAGRYSND